MPDVTISHYNPGKGYCSPDSLVMVMKPPRIPGHKTQDCIRRLLTASADHEKHIVAVTTDQATPQGRLTQLEADVKAFKNPEATLRDIQGKMATLQDIHMFKRDSSPKLRRAPKSLKSRAPPQKV